MYIENHYYIYIFIFLFLFPVYLGIYIFVSDLTESTYHRISDKTLNHMVDILEAIGDETDIEDFDLEYSVIKDKYKDKSMNI